MTASTIATLEEPALLPLDQPRRQVRSPIDNLQRALQTCLIQPVESLIVRDQYRIDRQRVGSDERIERSQR